jgi:hypothetical protein
VGVSLFSLWLPFRALLRALRCHGEDDYDEYNEPQRHANSVIVYHDLHLNEDSERSEGSISRRTLEHTGISTSAAPSPHHVVLPDPHAPWTHQQHFRVAIQIAPVWFVGTNS